MQQLEDHKKSTGQTTTSVWKVPAPPVAVPAPLVAVIPLPVAAAARWLEIQKAKGVLEEQEAQAMAEMRQVEMHEEQAMAKAQQLEEFHEMAKHERAMAEKQAMAI